MYFVLSVVAVFVGGVVEGPALRLHSDKRMSSLRSARMIY